MKYVIIAALIAIVLIGAQGIYESVFGHPPATEPLDPLWQGLDLWCLLVPFGGAVFLFVIKMVFGRLISGDTASRHDALRAGLDELNIDAYNKAAMAQKVKTSEMGRIAREADRKALQAQIEYYSKFPEKDENGKSLRLAMQQLHESRYYEDSPTTTDPEVWKTYNKRNRGRR